MHRPGGEKEATVSIALKTPGIHHLALRVTDLERAKEFYLDKLGFNKILETEGLCIFLVGSTPIGLRAADKSTPAGDRFDPHRVGLDHVAVTCEDEGELERAADALKRAGIDNTGVKRDDVLGKLYVAFKDPDGIKWEYYMA